MSEEEKFLMKIRAKATKSAAKALSKRSLLIMSELVSAAKIIEKYILTGE